MQSGSGLGLTRSAKESPFQQLRSLGQLGIGNCKLGATGRGKVGGVLRPRGNSCTGWAPCFAVYKRCRHCVGRVGEVRIPLSNFYSLCFSISSSIFLFFPKASNFT